MKTIEFQTTVKKITSAMPKDKQHEMKPHHDDEEVYVIVLTPSSKQARPHKDLLQDAKEKGYTDFLEYLMDNPFDIPNPYRFSRDELHER